MISARSEPDRLPLLLVEPHAETNDRYTRVLSDQFIVSTADGVAAAIEELDVRRPRLLVTEIAFPDGDGVEICRAARSRDKTIPVIVVTGAMERVAPAIKAGCDAVLVKPVAPNLVIGRIGRLLRAQSTTIRSNVARQLAKSAHLLERGRLLRQGTNVIWPDMACPHCRALRVTSFDYSGYRQMWCACLDCDHVWLTSRREVRGGDSGL